MSTKSEDRRLSDFVRPRALQHLRQFEKEAHQCFPGRVDRVVLFGSRARGTARRDSDYDVAVFVRGLADRRVVDHALADLAYTHILAGVHIRPIALPDDYLKTDQRGVLRARLAQEGLLVVDAEG